MRRTVTIHSVFVTAKLACLALNTLEDVLQRDKFSWFRHNRAAPLGLVVPGGFLAHTILGSHGLSLGAVLGKVALGAVLRDE
ncbi:hypothetical protein IVA87_20340 [Bradyrhizobium sp. 147]|uniref:hypothetical protein n=1 Tax=unclassified Bradyrhizobium TaxID=2631580 RepID=UPI001FF9A8EC|nr:MULTISPECIES: hypothetical protein [unclassified Bradyrhizobium]MCK1622331.1 hypothetical protein [Bradyrhizobium sp. 160]MCK1681698.1 hypothetical protein [Bradyrhizobium sp. 147]